MNVYIQLLSFIFNIKIALALRITKSQKSEWRQRESYQKVVSEHGLRCVSIKLDSKFGTRNPKLDFLYLNALIKPEVSPKGSLVHGTIEK